MTLEKQLPLIVPLPFHLLSVSVSFFPMPCFNDFFSFNTYRPSVLHQITALCFFMPPIKPHSLTLFPSVSQPLRRFISQSVAHLLSAGVPT